MADARIPGTTSMRSHPAAYAIAGHTGSMEPACAARFGDGTRRPASWKRSVVRLPVWTSTVPRERYQFGVGFFVVTTKRVALSATGVQVASVTGGWKIDLADVGAAADCAGRKKQVLIALVHRQLDGEPPGRHRLRAGLRQ